MHLTGRQSAVVLATFLAASACTSCVASTNGSHSALAPPSSFASYPYIGWTTWNLEDVHRPEYTITWMNEASTKKQAALLHKTLQPYGYNYVNIDSGWCGGFDGYGRPITDLKRYPSGMDGMAKYVHHLGQKLGFYWMPGIQHSQWDSNPPIYGTKYLFCVFVVLFF